MNKRYFVIIIFLILHLNLSCQSQKHVVYLIPGQGSDYRVYNKLKLPAKYDTVHIKHIIPQKKESLKDYSHRISSQIDTTCKHSIIGVSLGGMVATELAEITNPEKVIIVSSANCNEELPLRYTFMKLLPIYRIIPAIVYKYGSYIAQPLFEPDRRKEKETCVSMLQEKNPVFLKRATRMIVHWDRKQFSPKIIHIHGTKDHTLPYRILDVDYSINNGSHMMMLTKPDEINILILSILEQN